jgi:hypothetical protein
MHGDRRRAALLAGVLVVAATAGAVVGIGLRRGSAAEPFLALGQALLSTRGGLVPLPWLAFVGGFAVHAAIMLALGGAFALATSRWAGAKLATAAVACVLMISVIAWRAGPLTLGVYGGVAASQAEWVFLMVLLAVALYAGARTSRVS